MAIGINNKDFNNHAKKVREAGGEANPSAPSLDNDRLQEEATADLKASLDEQVATITEAPKTAYQRMKQFVTDHLPGAAEKREQAEKTAQAEREAAADAYAKQLVAEKEQRQNAETAKANALASTAKKPPMAEHDQSADSKKQVGTAIWIQQRPNTTSSTGAKKAQQVQ